MPTSPGRRTWTSIFIGRSAPQADLDRSFAWRVARTVTDSLTVNRS